jgi:hypothetical protein
MAVSAVLSIVTKLFGKGPFFELLVWQVFI